MAIVEVHMSMRRPWNVCLDCGVWHVDVFLFHRRFWEISQCQWLRSRPLLCRTSKSPVVHVYWESKQSQLAVRIFPSVQCYLWYTLFTVEPMNFWTYVCSILPPSSSLHRSPPITSSSSLFPPPSLPPSSFLYPPPPHPQNRAQYQHSLHLLRVSQWLQSQRHCREIQTNRGPLQCRLCQYQGM